MTMEETVRKFPVRPIGDRFIAEVIEGDDELRIENSDFILPKSDNSKPMKVKVIEISSDFDNSGLGLQIGDEVLISKYGSTSIQCGKENKRFQMCCKKDIIGIL